MSDWIPHERGLGHRASDRAFHGLTLPADNSVLGSVLADKNVLAVRSLTFRPYAQGPYSQGINRTVSGAISRHCSDCSKMMHRYTQASTACILLPPVLCCVVKHSPWVFAGPLSASSLPATPVTPRSLPPHLLQHPSQSLSLRLGVFVLLTSCSTEAYQWTPWSFKRRAATLVTEVSMPLRCRRDTSGSVSQVHAQVRVLALSR